MEVQVLCFNIYFTIAVELLVYRPIANMRISFLQKPTWKGVRDGREPVRRLLCVLYRLLQDLVRGVHPDMGPQPSSLVGLLTRHCCSAATQTPFEQRI